MSEQPPIAHALTALHIPHTVFTHSGPVTSLEDAASQRGQQPDQVVRSLVFRLAEGDFAIVLMAGPAQVSWKALRQHFGQSRLTTATEEEVLAVTGYVRGAVGPFGLRQPARILIDQGVMAQESISLGSGVRGTAIILTTADLRRALPDAEIGDFQGT